MIPTEPHPCADPAPVAGPFAADRADTCPRCRAAFVLRDFLVIHPGIAPGHGWYDDLAKVPAGSLVVCPVCRTLLAPAPGLRLRAVGRSDGFTLTVRSIGADPAESESRQ